MATIKKAQTGTQVSIPKKLAPKGADSKIKAAFDTTSGMKKYNDSSVLKSAKTYKAKDGKWIQKAVNPAHKGYCTPMTKATCTPKRKALAKTFKAMGRARKGK
jgi:hypothetical protein